MTTDDAAPEDGKVMLTIQTATGRSMQFKVKPTTQISKVFNTYAGNSGSKMADLRFLFDGSRLWGTDGETVADVGLEDGDRIDCEVYMVGGGSLGC